AWPPQEKDLSSSRSIRKLNQKTRFKNPYENELMIIKTQANEYVFQKWWSEKRLTVSLQCTKGHSSRRHVYFAEDREEDRELKLQTRGRSGDISVISLNTGGMISYFRPYFDDGLIFIL
ncbi:unnamed protein product, partial [Thlaspi arvense]